MQCFCFTEYNPKGEIIEQDSYRTIREVNRAIDKALKQSHKYRVFKLWNNELGECFTEEVSA